MVSGLQLLGMWTEDTLGDPNDTTYNNIGNRKSMVLEVSTTTPIYDITIMSFKVFIEEYNYVFGNSSDTPLSE